MVETNSLQIPEVEEEAFGNLRSHHHSAEQWIIGKLCRAPTVIQLETESERREIPEY